MRMRGWGGQVDITIVEFIVRILKFNSDCRFEPATLRLSGVVPCGFIYELEITFRKIMSSHCDRRISAGNIFRLD